MSSRLLVVGTLLGGIVLFAWQAVSHGVLGLPEKGMREFPGDSAGVVAHNIRAAAPTNGVYFSRYGVLAAVDISGDFADKTKQFVPMMAKQLALDLAIALVLTLLIGRLASPSVVQTGLMYALLALVFAGPVFLANGIWWNFPTGWNLGNVADQVIGFFLLGLTLAALERRFAEPQIETAERQGVRAPGGLGEVGRGQRVEGRG
jgi:hypothetical protein